jgi:hypothetical protein
MEDLGDIGKSEEFITFVKNDFKAMLGAIFGDMVGSIYEFNKHKNYLILNCLVKRSTFTGRFNFDHCCG